MQPGARRLGSCPLAPCPPSACSPGRPHRRDARLAAREHVRSSLEQVTQGTELRLRPITHLEGQPTLPTALRVDPRGGWADRRAGCLKGRNRCLHVAVEIAQRAQLFGHAQRKARRQRREACPG